MKEFIQSAKRTPYQSLASLLILFFTLFLSLFFFNLTSFFNGVLDYVETRPQVTVYFNVKTPESEIVKVRQSIESSGKSSSIKYISQKEALKVYRELNRDNPLLLEMVSSDILPASLEVYASRPEYLTQIAQFMQKQPNVDEVNFQQNIVDRLISLTTILRRVSMAMLLFLLLTAIVVLMTTTAFKIALKKDEIEILQLLGASKSYIRGPFLGEGVFFGFLAGSFAFVVFGLIFLSLRGFFASYLSTVPPLALGGLSSLHLFVWPPSLEFIALTYVLTIFFGMTIGFVGTMLASSKYIK